MPSKPEYPIWQEQEAAPWPPTGRLQQRADASTSELALLLQRRGTRRNRAKNKSDLYSRVSHEPRPRGRLLQSDIT
eukprot:167111-Prymnesium_polylepis.1